MGKDRFEVRGSRLETQGIRNGVIGFMLFMMALVLAACSDFHGPWDYYPEERDVYTGIYTYGYVMDGSSPYVCFSKVYELDESSAEDFAFYDSAYVTVQGRFTSHYGNVDDPDPDSTFVLSRSSRNPNCFEGHFDGVAGESYTMKAYFEWDSSGHKAKSRYKAVATVPNPVKVKGLSVPQQDGSYKWMAYNEKHTTFNVDFLVFPMDMEFVKCALDYDKTVRGVLAVLNYDINNEESQNTTINSMLSGLTEEDSTGYRGIAMHDPLERRQTLGFTAYQKIANYNALDTAYLMNMMLPLGSVSVDLYSTDAAYIDYVDKVKESVNDSRVIPESNIENGMGVFTGMSKTTVYLNVKGSGVPMKHIATRNCNDTEGDFSSSWDSRACRLYQDAVCAGNPNIDTDYYTEDYLDEANENAYKYYRDSTNNYNKGVKTCYASHVKAAMMLDTSKWSLFLPDTINEKAKEEAYGDGLKRYCVASNFESNHIADCSELEKQCIEDREKNNCKEYMWIWCADRGWPSSDQCKNALVSRYYLEEIKSSIIKRNVEAICSSMDYFNDEKKFWYPTCENWCKKDKDGNVKCK